MLMDFTSWLKLVGELADGLLFSGPVAAAIRSSAAVQILAEHQAGLGEDESEDSGRKCAIETRGRVGMPCCHRAFIRKGLATR